MIPTTMVLLAEAAADSSTVARARRLVANHDRLRATVPARVLVEAMSPLLEASAARDAAQRWRGRRSGTLILAGPTGTGKTTAAAGLALYHEAPARWIEATSAPARPDLRDELAAVPVLVIEEVGGFGATRPLLGHLGALLVARHAHGVLTIATTNWSREDFARGMEGCSPSESRLVRRIEQEGEYALCEGAPIRAGMEHQAAGTEQLARARHLVELVSRVRAQAEIGSPLTRDAERLALWLGIDLAGLAAGLAAREQQQRENVIVLADFLSRGDKQQEATPFGD